MALGPAIAIDAQSSLDMLFDRCAEDDACRDAFGDLRATFVELQAKLEETPVTVDIAHPRNGRAKQQQMNADALAGVVRLTSYSPTTRALLPLMIDEAANGRYQMLAAQSALVEDQFEDLLAVGMHNAVVCTEDAPFFDQAVDLDVLADTYMGSLQFEYLKEICSVWPAGVLDDGFKEVVTSDLPVLVLSGELDPVTPPQYGARAAETLSRSRHIVAPRQGHIVSAAGCMPKLIDKFIDELDASSLDAECVDKLDYMPVFVSPVGPTP
jgi:pimeloyl-ACP methyl ester carboxylesterase